MMEFRMIVVGGERWTEAFGASAVVRIRLKTVPLA